MSRDIRDLPGYVSPAVHYMSKDKQRLFEPPPAAVPDGEFMKLVDILTEQYRETLIALAELSAESATHVPDE